MLPFVPELYTPGEYSQLSSHSPSLLGLEPPVEHNPLVTSRIKHQQSCGATEAVQ